MSERALLTRRTTGTTVLTACLLGTTVALAPVAAAEPGRGAVTCAQLLEKAGEWPGSATIHGQEHRFYSDSHDLYLSRQAPCSAVEG